MRLTVKAVGTSNRIYTNGHEDGTVEGVAMPIWTHLPRERCPGRLDVALVASPMPMVAEWRQLGLKARRRGIIRVLEKLGGVAGMWPHW